MADDLEHQAARMVEALLESVGLHASYVDALEQPMARTRVPAEQAFARLPPVDRAAHLRLIARAQRHFGGSPELVHSALLEFLSKQYAVPAIDLADFEPSADALALLPEAIARAQALLPLVIAEGVLVVATLDPSDVDRLDALSRCAGAPVEPVVALLPDLDAAFDRAWPH